MIFLYVFFLAASQAAVAQLQPGDYLSTDYIRLALAAQSPIAAEKVGVVQMYTVKDKKGALSVWANWNFHESTEVFEVLPDGKVHVQESSAELGAPKIAIKDARHFLIQWPQGRRTALGGDLVDGEFELVGDAERWFFRKLIEGRYKTGGGTQITFRPDGTTDLSADGGSYKVGLDHVLVKFDYIYCQRNSYAFRFQNGALLIFDIVGEVVEKPKSQPRWKLYRVK
jgi:hypothetical protein